MESTWQYVLLGSCFAQNIGQRMCDEGWQAEVNPLGTLYNPESIRSCVHHALEGGTLPLFYDASMQEWRCWYANTRFRASSPQECERVVGRAFIHLGERLRKADVLILTLGTNVLYETPHPAKTDERIVVSNCQRQPARMFRERALSLAEVAQSLSRTIRCLRRHNPACRVLFTLSPYRYRKYGLHGNAVSKATLLMAIEAVKENTSDVFYFPSYEIMMDELRDYKFYASDGLHPAQEAIDILWNRFLLFQLG